MKKFYSFILLCFCLLGTYRSLAQPASSYDYISYTQPFGYLPGGNPVNRIETDDAVSLPIPIGFTFNFCGTDYTQVVASSNGWLSFNTGLTASTDTNSSTNLLAIRPALFPLWDDLSGAFVSGHGGSASFQTYGSAPNRFFVFEFRNWRWNRYAAPGITFQVYLYERSNIILYMYRRESGGLSSPSASIGIADEDGTYLSVTTASSVSSTGFTNTIGGKPANGTILQFSPQKCTTPTPGATLASPSVLCLGESADLSLSTPPPASKGGNTYQWQSSPDNVTYTNISGARAKTYRATPVAATWYRCKVSCSYSGTATNSSPVRVIFSGTVPTAANETRCGVGSVSLTASGAAGTTLRWYEEPIGGAALAEGAPFITPSLAATTDYYVGAEQTVYDTAVIGAGAQTTVSTGTTASDKISPFDHGYGGTKMQYLLKASELTARGMKAGDITSLIFDVVSGGTLFKGFKLSLRTTSATDLSSGTMMGGLTEVYAASDSAGLATPASGPLEIPFSTPFTWNGTANILVQTCWSNNNTGGTGSTVKYDSLNFKALNFYRADSKTADDVCSETTVGGTRNIRPKITFIQTSSCSSPRKKVTVTVNTAAAFAISDSLTVCNNSPARLSVSTPLANYTDYVWSPAADLYVDALCTVPYTAGSSAIIVYAKTSVAGKVKYTCNASNSVTKCGAIDSVDITTLPDTIAAIAAPPLVCKSGTSTLSLDASELGAARFQWAESSDDLTFTDIAAASSASYTTPTLSATRYYRAAIKNSAGAFCLNTTSDTVRVLNPGVTGKVNGVRCGPGTLTLSASGTGGTLKWYAASTGGTAIGTGSPFTTPIISATTTYYVSSEATEMSCKSDRVAVTATVNPLPSPAISPAGPVLICAGNTATLTGDGGGDYQWRNRSGHIAGATGKVYNTTVAEKYQVVVTNPTSGCKDSSAEVEVVVVAYPTVSIMPDRPLAICADSSREYTSTTTGGKLTYQWYNGAAAITGATAATYTATETGRYTLRVGNGTCADTSNEAVLTVNPLPAASFTETDSRDAICMDDSLELTALAVPAGSVYQWLFNGSDISGATRQKYYAKTSGYYAVRIRDANNCRKVSDEQLIINTPMGIPDLLPKDVLFCEGATIRLYAHAGTYAATYRWMKDGSLLPDSDPSITSGVTGSYEVTVTDVYGCMATSKKASVTVVPLPEKPLITHLGTTLSVKAGYAGYQWYRNGKMISGATKRTLDLSFDGRYHVTVSGGDCSNTSDTLEVKNLAVAEIHPAMSIKLYPNPAQNIVYIEAPVPVTLLVRDQQGRRVAEVRRAQQIDMSPYADGLYLFSFCDEQGQVLGTQNIMKKTE